MFGDAGFFGKNGAVGGVTNHSSHVAGPQKSQIVEMDFRVGVGAIYADSKIPVKGRERIGRENLDSSDESRQISPLAAIFEHFRHSQPAISAGWYVQDNGECALLPTS